MLEKVELEILNKMYAEENQLYLDHNWVEVTGVKLPIISRNGAAKFVIFVSRFKDSCQITRGTVVFTSPRWFSAEECWYHYLKTITEDLHKSADQKKSVMISVITADLLHHIIDCETHDFVWNTYMETNKKSLTWSSKKVVNMFSPCVELILAAVFGTPEIQISQTKKNWTNVFIALVDLDDTSNFVQVYPLALVLY